MARVEVVPVQRAELMTQDLELLEDLVRQLYGDHVGRFACDDPVRIDGQIRSNGRSLISPMPPWICKASSDTIASISVALSLAIAMSESVEMP